MASKRKKRASSSATSQPFDTNRFVSQEASQRYHQLLVNKPLLSEKGLLPEPEDGAVASMIRKRTWQRFTSHPEPAAVNIVREFYANAKERVGNTVMVRGQEVNMGRKAINAYYGLQKINRSGYSKYIEKELDYSEIIAQLCEPGTDWKPTATNEATNFQSSKLSRYGKAWFAFICAKLMPARHRTDVTKERAALLYCIVLDKSVDVGEMIHASMLKALEGGTSGGLPHPSLITDLCKHAGVPWDIEEVLQVPLAPIDHTVISRFKVWAGGESHPKGRGYTILSAAHADAGPSQPAVSMPPPDVIEEFRRDSRHHTRRIDLVARRVEHAIRRIDCVAQRQESILSYQAEAYTALTQMMSNVACHLPDPPTLLPYPPLSPDLDAAMTDSDD